MKHLKNKLLIILPVVLVVLNTSCKKSFYTDVNKNTNAPDPTSIIPSVMLSTVQGTLAYAQGGDFSRYTSLITQQTSGASRQAGAYYQYIFTSVDFDSPWGNLFTSVMENDRTLIQISDAKGDNGYGGISRILMGYSLQLAVDMWGSVPYSQAFQGATNLQPKYDDGKALYDTISLLLSTAITKLSDPNVGPDEPGSEDVIYGGDLTKWIKFAHAIQARLYIHQSKGNAAMATNALSEIAQSFTSNSDNAQYLFSGGTETSANPWYQFNEQRGDISFDVSPLGDMLNATNDPRYTIFTTPLNAQGKYTDVNQVGMGDYYGSLTAPVEFITYDELLFMKAEATLRATGNIASAQIFYAMAITANMQKLGVAPAAIAAYLAANGALPATASGAIAQVANQEYIALYLNPEAFTLWRRTGSPNLTPIVGTKIPRRFLYPQTEISYNGANVPQSTLYAPQIFWDN
ncbi:MAG: SusD/RagB family nutrient-binding outer membrane lipoprotein [Bacteroidota bacterium]|nr:SusD/RagB family nutrient-binding outer membrane lipoprotein [Bacteroidota bacterium]